MANITIDELSNKIFNDVKEKTLEFVRFIDVNTKNINKVVVHCMELVEKYKNINGEEKFHLVVKIMNYIINSIRAILLHFVLLFTNWLPDNVIFLRFRGFLANFFLMGTCKNLRIGRNVTFYNPSKIYIDDDEIAAPDWLKQMILAYQNSNALLIGGPLRCQPPKHKLTFFQKLMYKNIEARYRRKEFRANGGRFLSKKN